eukprot:365117-Chlamydomonas_euryale.AAC.5
MPWQLYVRVPPQGGGGQQVFRVLVAGRSGQSSGMGSLLPEACRSVVTNVKLRGQVVVATSVEEGAVVCARRNMYDVFTPPRFGRGHTPSIRPEQAAAARGAREPCTCSLLQLNTCALIER